MIPCLMCIQFLIHGKVLFTNVSTIGHYVCFLKLFHQMVLSYNLDVWILIVFV